MVLDEKYFRQLKAFNGDVSEYRGWLFDLIMVLNQIDSAVAEEINKVLKECGSDGQNWDCHGRMDQALWEKYRL